MCLCVFWAYACISGCMHVIVGIYVCLWAYVCLGAYACISGCMHVIVGVYMCLRAYACWCRYACFVGVYMH